jgi:hypothetical protein
MQLNGYQIYVRSEQMADVANSVRASAERLGCDAYLDPRSEKPSPIMGRRKLRTFTVAPPRDGYVVVWEDGAWADKRLAEEVSRDLGVDVLWVMLSSSTSTWAFVRYANGARKDATVDTSPAFLENAKTFADDKGLPYAFAYFPDPNLADEVEAFDKWVAAGGPNAADVAPADIEVVDSPTTIPEIESEALFEDRGPTPNEAASFGQFTVACDSKRARPVARGHAGIQ